MSLMVLVSCTKQSQLDWFMPNVAAPNPSLSANFRINHPNNTVNEQSPVSITNLSTQAVAYHWDFGNGTTSTEKTPVLSYSKCGIYPITLTVTGVDGSIQKATQEVISLCIFGGVHDGF